MISMNLLSNNSAGGLLFTSSAEKVDMRTSMVIFGDKQLKLEDSFMMSFDLSIWDLKQFGHIFRLINEQKKEVEFVFVNFYGIDNMYLDFHSPIKHKSVQIPISRESIEQKEILHIDIQFDLKQDKASILLKDSVYSCSPIGLENPSSLQFAFGLYGLNLDVPQMLIRNLEIKKNDGKIYFFPLKESSGNIAHDESGKIKAEVKNPEWVVNKHYYWETKSKFRVKNKSFIVFDEANNSIIIVNKDSLISYFPKNNKSAREPMLMPSNFEMVDAVYNNLTQKIIIINGDSNRYHNNSGSFLSKKNIDFIVPTNGRNLLHHNSFFSSTGDMYQFGGFGNYSYSDKISIFNKDDLEWDELEFSGDKITQRYYSAAGNGANPNEILIFGGFGNETGKQEHVGHNLYDLYKIDLNEKKITKIWELRETPKNEFVPGNNLILSKDKYYFYTLSFAHHKSDSYGFLQRFNLKTGIYETVSDSIRVTSEDMNTTVNLFFNNQMNEFYAVVSELTENDSTNIHIYTLMSPPILKTELENPTFFQFSKLILCVFFGLLVVFTILYFSRRINKKQNLHTSTLENEFISHAEHTDDYPHKKSAIYIFGTFTAFDKKGQDISHRFSNKLRALFILILLSTKDDSKISTEKLTSHLWPDKNSLDAKNIRGVTINRLRNILIDMDGITLVHESSHWYFVISDQFYCDYIEYSSIVPQLNNTTKESFLELMAELIPIIHKGPFLYNTLDEIIEKYKSIEEHKIEIILREYIIFMNVDKNYRSIVQIAPSYFSAEPLNNEIMEICYRAYIKLSKKDDAKTFLNNYKKIHEMMTGEEYRGVL